MTFVDSGKKARGERNPKLRRICANCHKTYGQHYGTSCPQEGGK